MVFVSLTLIAIIIYIYKYLKKHKVPIEDVAISSQKIFREGEYWRIFTGSLSHYEFQHFLMNLISVYSFIGIELTLGSITYLKFIIILIISSSIIVSLFLLILQPIIQIHLVGFSMVLFGLIAYQSSFAGNDEKLFNTNIPYSYLPYVMLIVMKIVCFHSSLLGHIAGIIIGYAYKYKFFYWYTNSLFIITIPFIAYFFLNNYNETHENKLEWFEKIKEMMHDKFSEIFNR